MEKLLEIILCAADNINVKKFYQLRGPNWLRQQYVENRLSSTQIAKLSGTKSHKNILRLLRKYEIPIRTKGEGLICNRQDDGFIINESVLTGCLLGDGGLRKKDKSSDGYLPVFYKKNIFYNHIKIVGEALLGDTWCDRHYVDNNDKNNKHSTIHRLETLSHKELLPIYKSWYPENNNFKKIIPNDIPLDPVVLLHWFLDDGFASFRNDRPSITAGLCTDCFLLEHQEVLIHRINNIYNLGFSLKKIKLSYGIGWRIRMKSSKMKEFFNIIGKCPVPELSYKWKLPQNL